MAVAVADADTPAGLIAAQLLNATRSHAAGFTESDHALWLRERGGRTVVDEEELDPGLRRAAPHGLAALIDLGGRLSSDDGVALGIDPDHIVSVRGSTPGVHRIAPPTGSTSVLDRVLGLVGAGLICVPVAQTVGLTAVSIAAEDLIPRRGFGITALVSDAAIASPTGSAT